MNPIEKALVLGNGGQWLDALSSPYATALMWILPVIFEMALVYVLVRAWRNRKAFSQKPGLPGTPVTPVSPSGAVRDRLVIRAPRDGGGKR